MANWFPIFIFTKTTGSNLTFSTYHFLKILILDATTANILIRLSITSCCNRHHFLFCDSHITSVFISIQFILFSCHLLFCLIFSLQNKIDKIENRGHSLLKNLLFYSNAFCQISRLVHI